MDFEFLVLVLFSITLGACSSPRFQNEVALGPNTVLRQDSSDGVIVVDNAGPGLNELQGWVGFGRNPDRISKGRRHDDVRWRPVGRRESIPEPRSPQGIGLRRFMEVSLELKSHESSVIRDVTAGYD
ncbi:MAG: hypothetical protein V3W41_15765 [Planctomycetota bacterium]